MNVETGEVLEGGEAAETSASAALVTPGGRRHSTRTHTVANTSATVSRVRDEVRKVCPFIRILLLPLNDVSLAIISAQAREDKDQSPDAGRAHGPCS